MITPEKRKQDILKTISYNPTEITIKRTRKVLKDGYFENVEETIGLIVRIYSKGISKSNIKSSENGTSYDIGSFGMLCDSENKIMCNSKYKDEFICELGHFIVTSAFPQVVQNVLCGYQCQLERID